MAYLGLVPSEHPGQSAHWVKARWQAQDRRHHQGLPLGA
jgi:hypothetical protein